MCESPRLAGMALTLGVLLLLSAQPWRSAWSAEDAKYVGVEKCKNCHAAAAKGDPYTVWTKEKHSQAYQVLASAEAKKAGAAKKVDNPQQSAECLRCHVTGYEAPATQKHKKFDPTLGVQCESCHGPGGKHVEARLAAEEADPAKVQQIGKDEIIHEPTVATCRKCHNPESPNYKPFCFKKAAKEIAHLDPRRNHPADFFEKLPCDCDECKKGGAPPEPKK